MGQCLGRSPETATVEGIRKFQLHLARTGTSAQRINARLTSLRFLFEHTLDRPELASKIRRVREEHRLPVVLRKDEVTKLIDCAPGMKYQTVFSIAYGAGIRAGEVVARKTGDVDSQRMTLRIEQGKGNKDRYAMRPRAACAKAHPGATTVTAIPYPTVSLRLPRNQLPIASRAHSITQLTRASLAPAVSSLGDYSSSAL